MHLRALTVRHSVVLRMALDALPTRLSTVLKCRDLGIGTLLPVDAAICQSRSRENENAIHCGALAGHRDTDTFLRNY